MSTYYDLARHPSTGQVEKALWIDDHFGWRRYGVQFADGSIWRPEQVRLEQRAPGSPDSLPLPEQTLRRAGHAKLADSPGKGPAAQEG